MLIKPRFKKYEVTYNHVVRASGSVIDTINPFLSFVKSKNIILNNSKRIPTRLTITKCKLNPRQG